MFASLVLRKSSSLTDLCRPVLPNRCEQVFELSLRKRRGSREGYHGNNSRHRIHERAHR
jgi:hypothetical protein